MNALRDIVRFQSDRFSPFLPDESQVNPGVYGAELAFWLASELARRDIFTSYPQSEDWGWYIEYITASGSEFAVHCGNEEGSMDLWLLSLRRHARKMFGRDKAPCEDAALLVAGIRAVMVGTLPTADIEWLYDDENDE